MTEIELLEYVLKNIKSGEMPTKGLLIHGREGRTVSVSGVSWERPQDYSLAPRTHKVNGFTVPAPEVKAPSLRDCYWIPCLEKEDMMLNCCWGDWEADKRFLSIGLIHLTKEAAIANTRAMLKIDPKWNQE